MRQATCFMATDIPNHLLEDEELAIFNTNYQTTTYFPCCPSFFIFPSELVPEKNPTLTQISHYFHHPGALSNAILPTFGSDLLALTLNPYDVLTSSVARLIVAKCPRLRYLVVPAVKAEGLWMLLRWCHTLAAIVVGYDSIPFDEDEEQQDEQDEVNDDELGVLPGELAQQHQHHLQYDSSTNRHILTEIENERAVETVRHHKRVWCVHVNVVIHSQPQPCQSLQDVFDTAKNLWHRRNYTEAFRIFYELGERYEYNSSACAWYQIQCLLALGHWRQAILISLEQTKKCSSEQWHLIASDIYMSRCDYTLAWEILNRAPHSARVIHDRRLAYEGIQHAKCIRRNDILDILPYDVALNVFMCLDLSSLARCTRVSKRWRHCLVFSPHLWNELEFVKPAMHLPISTVNAYLSRLGRLSLTKLVIRHQQTDGDGILMALLAQQQCRRLKTLIISDMICTPALFFNALEYIGSTLYSFHWGGVSLRLNDIIDVLPRICTQLKCLRIQDCFTSLYDAQFHNGTLYRLESFGDRFPATFTDTLKTQSLLPYVETLELSAIHGFTVSHLASIVIRCPNLKKLVLYRCLVDIIPVLNILQTNCPKLQYFEYERNRYCQQFDMYQLSPSELDEKRYEPYFCKPQYPWKQVKIHLTHTLTDNVLENLLHGSKTALETLDLRGNTIISDQGLLCDTSMKNLKTLCLRECHGLTSRGLITLLAQSPLLEHVDLSHLDTIDDGVLQRLATCQNLHTLDLSYANLNVTSETFKHFIDQRMLTLKRLALDFTTIPKELLCYSMMKLKTSAI
ncbi:hypothetical protein [Parasitella parasitica]|uniref:F-box domain-containing protein n=1 Tax=Parasitella parasitica TaxID=35722 RepID=A0A0B7N7G0_9FUNG|nr:hypothetical protein [Parasitella parasitica]